MTRILSSGRIQINQITPITLGAIDEKNRKIAFKMATIPYLVFRKLFHF
jgi:hypothetical protein